MTIRKQSQLANRPRATKVLIAALGATALAAPTPALADPQPTPAPARVLITGVAAESHEFDRPVSVNGSTGVVEPIAVAPAPEIILPVLSDIEPVLPKTAPVQPIIQPPASPTLPTTGTQTVDVAALIAAKHAEFPPASPVVLQAALARCTPAIAFSPTANWLEIAVTLITTEEGFDANWKDLGDGMWTIGYGHAVSKSEYPSPPSDVSVPLSADAAAQLLISDLINLQYVPAVDIWFTENLPPVVFGAMVSYSYNTGPRGFEKYYIPKQDLAAIAEAITHASDHQGNQFPGLICRRAREAALIRSAIR